MSSLPPDATFAAPAALLQRLVGPLQRATLAAVREAGLHIAPPEGTLPGAPGQDQLALEPAAQPEQTTRDAQPHDGASETSAAWDGTEAAPAQPASSASASASRGAEATPVRPGTEARALPASAAHAGTGHPLAAPHLPDGPMSASIPAGVPASPAALVQAGHAPGSRPAATPPLAAPTAFPRRPDATQAPAPHQELALGRHTAPAAPPGATGLGRPRNDGAAAPSLPTNRFPTLPNQSQEVALSEGTVTPGWTVPADPAPAGSRAEAPAPSRSAAPGASVSPVPTAPPGMPPSAPAPGSLPLQRLQDGTPPATRSAALPAVVQPWGEAPAPLAPAVAAKHPAQIPGSQFSFTPVPTGAAPLTAPTPRPAPPSGAPLAAAGRVRLVKAAPAAPMAQEPGLPPAAAASPFGADTAPPDTPSTTPLADRAAASATQSAPLPGAPGLPAPAPAGARWPAELERRLERHLDRALTPLRTRAAQSAGDTAAGLDDTEAAEAPRISQTFNVRLAVGAPSQAGGLAAWQAGDAFGDALRDAALRQGLMP